MGPREQPARRSRFSGSRGLAQWMVAYQTINVIRRLTDRALRPHGLSQPQLHLLCVLKAAGGGLAIGEIARAMVRATQTVTALADRLERQALVERYSEKSDRRKTLIRLTEAGERKLEEAAPTQAAFADEVVAQFSDEELEQFEAKLRQMGGALLNKLHRAPEELE